MKDITQKRYVRDNAQKRCERFSTQAVFTYPAVVAVYWIAASPVSLVRPALHRKRGRVNESMYDVFDNPSTTAKASDIVLVVQLNGAVLTRG